MIVLLTGPTGFIGSHLARALTAAGHVVVRATRHPSASGGDIQADFTSDLHVRDWVPKLAGVNAVINTVGIFRESGQQTFERLHTQAPQALFAACVSAGVRRVIHFSALGANTGTTCYFESKRAADQFLEQMPLEWTVVQPSLVYGPGGVSARLFSTLASLPLIPVPGRGEQLVQPVHIDDLTQAVVHLLTDQDAVRRRVPIVGPQPLTLREFLRQLRRALGLGDAHFIRMPLTLVRVAARISGALRLSLLDRDALVMLEAGNTGDATYMRRSLRGQPRPPSEFVKRDDAASVAATARLQWLLPLLRASVAAVWIWTGIVSLGLYPQAQSYELLARTGITGALAPLMLYGAAILDLALGVGTLLLRRRWLWLLQLALILFYTAVISFRLPEFWLHPYGPLLKNLPMLACIYLLYCFEDRPWNTSS
jgi:nucleoside-diphosphate-sugar epimerase